jgi:hypothetical protein
MLKLKESAGNESGFRQYQILYADLISRFSLFKRNLEISSINF